MPFIFAIGLMILSYAISALLVKRQPPMKPAAFEDFQFAQVEEGTPQAVFFGDVWTAGWFVMWYGNMRSTPIKKKAKKK